MKKLLTLIIALALLCTACSTSEVSDNTQSASVESTAMTEPPEETVVNWESSGLPKEDFGGEEFVTLYGSSEPSSEQAWRMINSAAVDGDVLNDAIYNRNRKIEDIYNISMDVVYNTGFENAAKASISAADNAYDTFFASANTLLSMSQNNYLLDWNKLPHTDLDAVWWDSSVVEGLTVGGKLYMCTGDISPLTNVRVYSLVFNKDLCRELGLDLPYESVLAGNWTIDLFSNYITNVNYDVNGDGKMDYEDRWGYFSQNGNSYMMYFSGGGRVTDITADGGRELSFDNERNVNLAIKALEVSIDKNKTLMANTYVTNNGGSWAAASSWFAAGGSLMRSSVFEPVPRDYRAMDTDFGVLPYPKLDEQQERYYTLPEHTSYMYAHPVTADITISSLILEALAAESVSTVSDAFYDVCLNGKVIRDEESKDMLDIIFGSKIFDIGYFIGAGDIMNTLTNLETKSSTDVTSAFGKIQKSSETTLQKFLDKYAALE